jgi:hypothetical protein
MRVHITDPELLPELIRFVGESTDCIAERAGYSEAEVSILGSRRLDENRRELARRLQAWNRAHPAAQAELADGDPLRRRDLAADQVPAA